MKKTPRQLRKQSTPAESLLWLSLKNRQLLGLKFRRQHPIQGYIVDFCCHEHQVVIEVDGDVHALEENQKRDQFRQNIIEQAGYRVFRFTNQEVGESKEEVLEHLYEELKKCLPSPQP